jgi:hypothetical protein
MVTNNVNELILRIHTLELINQKMATGGKGQCRQHPGGFSAWMNYLP